MSRRRPRFQSKTYGSTHIGGRANVQLGDSHVVNNYNVDTAVVALPDDLVGLLQSVLVNSNAGPAQRQTRKTSIRIRAQRSKQPGKLESNEIPTAQELGSSDRPRSLGDTSRQESGSALSNTIHKSATGQGILKIVQALYTSIRVNTHLRHPRIPALPFPQPVPKPHGNSTTLEIYQEEDNTVATQDQPHVRALHDLLLISTVALSCLLGRNISAKDFAVFLAKCRHDQLLPLLTFVLGTGIYRLIATRALLSSPLQHFVTLEDAYARNVRIGMDILMDYSVMNSFLKAHYHRTDSVIGERLISAGQYHLMLGSRRGMVLGRVNWSSAVERIKPGFRLINSVYLDSVDAACVGCKATLVVSVLGDFHCSKCDVFYRDDAALQTQLLASVVAARKPQSGDHHPLRNPTDAKRSSSGAPTELERISTDSLPPQHDFGGLRHLDLRIVPPSQEKILEESKELRPRQSRAGVDRIGPSFVGGGNGGSKTGVVEWFNDSKGFEFVTPNEGGESLFVHFSAISSPGFKTLSRGQIVNFDVTTGPKGKQASNVAVNGVLHDLVEGLDTLPLVRRRSYSSPNRLPPGVTVPSFMSPPETVYSPTDRSMTATSDEESESDENHDNDDDYEDDESDEGFESETETNVNLDIPMLASMDGLDKRSHTGPIPLSARDLPTIYEDENERSARSKTAQP